MIKTFIMYLGIGFGCGIAGLLYCYMFVPSEVRIERNACLIGWKHSAMHYKVYDQQSPEAIIEYGREHCEEWYK